MLKASIFRSRVHGFQARGMHRERITNCLRCGSRETVDRPRRPERGWFPVSSAVACAAALTPSRSETGRTTNVDLSRRDSNGLSLTVPRQWYFLRVTVRHRGTARYRDKDQNQFRATSRSQTFGTGKSLLASPRREWDALCQMQSPDLWLRLHCCWRSEFPSAVPSAFPPGFQYAPSIPQMTTSSTSCSSSHAASAFAIVRGGSTETVRRSESDTHPVSTFTRRDTTQASKSFYGNQSPLAPVKA